MCSGDAVKLAILECTVVTLLESVEHFVTLFMVLHKYREHLHKKDPLNAYFLYSCRKLMLYFAINC